MSRDSNRANGYTAARYVFTALLITGFFCASAGAISVSQKKQLARNQFETAERMREALHGRPSSQLKARDYKRVIDAYRKVYYISPTSPKAAESVVAVAELLVEEGRATKNDDTLKQAIEKYEFLRNEYPGSKQRVEALFTIAQVYQDDLGDTESAKATFQEFLKRYPNSDLADDARSSLNELQQTRAKATRGSQKTPKADAAKVVDVAKPDASRPEPSKQDDERHADALVTGVRHWSTPDYTRIAIDLEQEVTYESGRIPNPDRIYFDLKDTKLSSVLKGKTFDVDDGYLKKIRVAQYLPGKTRIVLEVVDDVSEYSAFMLPNPYRLVIDIHGKKPSKLYARTEQPQSAPETVIADKPASVTVAKAPEPKAQKNGVPDELATVSKKSVPIKIVEPDDKPVTTAKSTTPTQAAPSQAAPSQTAAIEPPLKIRGKKRQAPETLNVHTAEPTSDGERSLIRTLGLKIGRIVIDAGHGGHDTGTIGPNGLLEKDLVLDVALRLGKLLEDRLGAPVVYTRDDDTFIPLETRTAIANQQQADLFISIHANSSHDSSARGVETYYLNFTSSRDALEVAARENAVSETSIHDLQDLVKKIALKDKIEESREFALDVQQSLHGNLSAKAPAIRDRGVKKAPFIVLIGANMPSILAEISFISNPTDEKRLKTPDYRQKIADSLYKGVAKYVGGLSGVKVASKLSKDIGQ